MPNALYVACTRASELLILVGEAMEGDKLPFLMDIKPSAHLDVFKIGQIREGKKEPPKPASRTSVTRLVKFLPEEVKQRAMSFVKWRVVTPPYQALTLTSQVRTGKGMMDDVAEITGVALPALFERRSTDQSLIHLEALDVLGNAHGSGSNSSLALSLNLTAGLLDDSNSAYLREIDRDYNATDVPGYLRLANIYLYCVNGFLNKVSQIKAYDWISPSEADACIDVLAANLKGNVWYESIVYYGGVFPFAPVSSNKSDDDDDDDDWVNEPSSTGKFIEIDGRVDSITPDGIAWELKCTHDLEDEHLLQLAVYAWMLRRKPKVEAWRPIKERPKKGLRDPKKSKSTTRRVVGFRLLNMRSGEQLELTSSFEELEACVSVLVE